EARAAQLRPAEPAMVAHAAAAVVVVHDPHAGARLGLGHPGADLDHDAARLVAGDDRLGEIAQAERPLGLAGRGAVELEIAAAHARGLDLQHDLAGTRTRVGKVADLQLAITGEHHAAHAAPSLVPLAPTRRSLEHFRPPWNRRTAAPRSDVPRAEGLDAGPRLAGLGDLAESRAASSSR